MKETQLQGGPSHGTPVTVPHLAETLVSATVGRWLKKPGDYIQEYDIICELLTEKVNVEMPCPIEGVLKEILVREGETADVGQAICLIEEKKTAGASSFSGNGDTSRKMSDLDGLSAIPMEEELTMRHRYSPSVMKLANEHEVELKLVKGTGLGGRITRKDVEMYVEQGKPGLIPPSHENNAQSIKEAEQPLRTTGLHLSENPTIPWTELDDKQTVRKDEYYIDVTPIRNTIASRMRQSVSEIPHAWTMIEVDVSNLVVLRNKWKDEFVRKEGLNLTYLAFLLKAVVSAIKDYPIMNSLWGVDKIIVKRDINISLAVGTEDSVITPVIKKADEKNIAGLAREIDELTKKVRTGKFTLSDVTGGTFTVNNTGSFGSILSYPIINYPQAAILTFESIVKKPVVIQDMIAVRSIVNLCLSLDHRILDGVICGRFLQRVKENLENYNPETNIY